MFWKKHKEKKINKEYEDILDTIKIKKSLGTNAVYLPISDHIINEVKQWCSHEGYRCEVDHLDEDGNKFYKIWGWE